MTSAKAAINPFLRDRTETGQEAAGSALGAYPRVRLRRNRKAAWSRRLVRETQLSADDFIWPVFIQESNGQSEVDSMPGVRRHGPDCLVDALGEAVELGIPAVELFPFVEPGLKQPDGREAINPDGLVCRAIRSVKAAYPDLGVLCDVALDPFNSDGHDGILCNGEVLNDETLEILCRQALVQAEAGCDINAPSDMMDGRIGVIRDHLDAHGFQSVQLLSYAAKYASAFYGPFREAIGSGGFLKGDKKTYQLDPANSDEALRETALDIQEGADMVMVKPGMPYLDIIRRLKDAFGLPTLVYQVSGEYAMLKGAAARGWLDNDRIVLESLMAFKRAGADAILTYFAPEAARLLKRG